MGPPSNRLMIFRFVKRSFIRGFGMVYVKCIGNGGIFSQRRKGKRRAFILINR